MLTEHQATQLAEIHNVLGSLYYSLMSAPIAKLDEGGETGETTNARTEIAWAGRNAARTYERLDAVTAEVSALRAEVALIREAVAR